MKDAKEQLIALLKEKSVQWGSFTLSSGRTSDFYVDVRQTALHAEGSALIGRLILHQLHPDVEAVGGETMGADPIACSAAAISVAHGRPVHAFLIRKNPKDHGTNKFVEGRGNLPPGTRVAIVEDTSTTGASLLRAVARAREAGLEVVQCITVVDREEGAADAVRRGGHTLEPLVTRTELAQR